MSRIWTVVPAGGFQIVEARGSPFGAPGDTAIVVDADNEKATSRRSVRPHSEVVADALSVEHRWLPDEASGTPAAER
jgi:hypothetical protein